MAERLKTLKSLEKARDEWLRADIKGINKHSFICRIDALQAEYGQFWSQFDRKLDALKAPKDYEG